MSDPPTSQARSLNEGKIEVLQALLSSVALNADHPSANSKLSAEQAQKITDKLEDLLGQNVGAAARNEKGELLNEEGLPIIEINEPHNTSEAYESNTTPQNNGNKLHAWANQSPAQIEARRRNNAHLLDMLEEEEREEEERAVEQERLQRQRELERRKEAARGELDRMKAQRELQKKMGKALMRNMAAVRAREEEREQETLQSAPSTRTEGSRKPRKSVSFAELPKSDRKVGDAPRSAPLDWGDVAPGRLNRMDGASSKQSDMDRPPMKFDVVERIPSRPAKPTITMSEADSDDETDPDSLSPGEPLDGHSPPSDSESLDTLADDDDDSKSNDHVGDMEFVEDEYDFDTAQHQREVALRYFEQRDAIGKEALTAMTSHTHEGGEHEWDQPEVPLEATLVSAPPKPAVSKFKAARLSPASTYGKASPEPQSTSLGGAVLPATQAKAIQRAIRTGKLEDDKLVGGEAGESDDEPADVNTEAFMEMLKSGEIRNVGPDGEEVAPTSAAPSSGSPATVTSTVVERSASTLKLSPAPAPSSAAPAKNTLAQNDHVGSKPRASRFKMNQALQGTTPSDQPIKPSPLGTPINLEERSSPKLRDTTQIVRQQVVERAARVTGVFQSLQTPTAGPSSHQLPSRDPVPISAPTLASRPPPKAASSHLQQAKPAVTASPAIVPSMIVDSPSFPKPGVSSSAMTQTVATFTPQDQEWLAQVEAATAAFVAPTRRPVVASRVVESKGPHVATPDEAPKKVSRFLAERI